MKIPRLIISALKGGGGKTLLSLGIGTAFRKRGLQVAPFKKGPDYIDAMWLSLAAKSKVYNLDPYFLENSRLRALLQWAMAEKDIAIIEGNRGLYDGRDILGTCSTASLAKTLDAPVILSVDCTKVTRTTAAMLLGMLNFDRDVKIAGVVLNNISSKRHESIIRQSIEYYTDIKVMGAIYRLQDNPLPERHMGLIAFNDKNSEEIENLLCRLADIIESSLDLDNLITIAEENSYWLESGEFWQENDFSQMGENSDVNTLGITRENSDSANVINTIENSDRANISTISTNLPSADLMNESSKQDRKYLGKENINESRDSLNNNAQGKTISPCNVKNGQRIHFNKPIIGYVRDAALWFYYNENLESLSRAGAKLIELSILDPKQWTKIQGLYLGGGYPEEFAKIISCSPHLKKIQELSLAGNPIYAECGGFMILANALVRNGIEYAMAKIFPCKTYFNKKPQGLGYVEVKVGGENIFYPQQTIFRGHEFHYSHCEFELDAKIETVLELSKGVGMGNGKDGLLVRNTFASYTHLYAPAMPTWARHFVQAAKKMST